MTVTLQPWRQPDNQSGAARAPRSRSHVLPAQPPGDPFVTTESASEVMNAVRSKALPRLKSLRNRIVNPSSGPRLCVFVAGVHRSGTNMMMDILERSWETDVLHESDSRAFEDNLMR